MKIKEAENKIKKAGGDVGVFWKWLREQTMELNEYGTTD